MRALQQSTLYLLLCLLFWSCKDTVTDVPFGFSDTIAFTATDGYVYTMDSNGDKKEQFYHVRGSSPKYSPDGKSLSCYWWDLSIQEQWLVTFDCSDGSMERIAFNKGLDEFGISTYSWSGDGSKIVYSRTLGDFNRSDIFVVDVNSKAVVQLTDDGFNFDPRWSPDRQQIAFVKNKDGLQAAYLMNADGTNATPAPYRGKGLIRSLEWSPDGKKIVFHGPPDSASLHLQNDDIYVVNGDGSGLQRLTFDGTSAAAYWSPDGKQLLFQSRRDGMRNLYIMDTDGTNIRQLTNFGEEAVGAPYYWSPTGDKILYASTSASTGQFTLRVVFADGSKNIDTQANLSWGFAWKPY